MAKPVSPEERERIIAAFATGSSCRQIAKEFGRSTTTISHIARSVGHEFGQINTQRAREINSEYNAERRATIRLSTVQVIEERLKDFNAPTLVYSFGGRDNDYNEHTLDRPDARTMRDLAQTIATLWRVIESIDKAEETQNDLAGFDKVFQIADRMADEYEFVQPETGPQHIEGDG